MQLRPYQQAAIDSVWRYLEQYQGNPCVVLPTGAGKTPVLVALARHAAEQWGARILILAHVKELLSQAVDKFQQWWPMAPVGVYSAGLKRRDTADQILVAGIQSVYAKADKLGVFDLVIIDEAHLVPADGDGMYRQLLADLTTINPKARVVGLTATPYRLDCGMICGSSNILTEVCYEANVRELIDQGFLSKLRGKAGTEADISGVHMRGGDFIQGELEEALADEETVRLACDEILSLCPDRRAWVVFCVGVKHADMVRAELAARGVACAVITGETPIPERDASIEAFKAGALRALININVLSIGFDAPHIDAVIMLRPTESPGLYYQQVGRGLRMSPGKSDCLVLDLAGNVRRHGPIDRVSENVAAPGERGEGDAPTKVCDQCREILPTAVRVCPVCGFEFPPPPVAKHATKADTVAPVSPPPELHTWEVTDIDYQVWSKRGAPADAPKTVCVTYRSGLIQTVREWVCVEHSGYAASKARTWWSERTKAPMPTVAKDAVELIWDLLNGRADGTWREPSHVVVKLGGQYPELSRHIFSRSCATCLLYDAGYCHKWDSDVPQEHRADGCDSHAEKTQHIVAANANDEPPF